MADVPLVQGAAALLRRVLVFDGSRPCDHESRLELARLLLADFDPEMRHVVAQPFLLRAEVEGKPRRHVPDYLLITDRGAVLVDVKPRRRLDRPEVAFTFA